MAHNRFDFLRLLFAGTVVAYHSVALSGLDVGGAWERTFTQLAELSIQGFFVISGALVYGSWTRSRGPTDYASKRVRRLYPAYVVIILIPALIALILSLSKGGGSEAITHVARYLAANLVFLNFLEPSLPGFFEGQRYPVVNGALWTLKIEVMFYMIVPMLGWLMLRAGRWKWGFLAFIYVGAEIWRAGVPHLEIPRALDFARQLPGQMSFFASGISLWILRDRIRPHLLVIGLVGAAFLALSIWLSLETFRAAGLAGIIAYIAFMPGPRLDAARWGDISYGVYITHFPIVNTLVILGVFAASPWLGFGLSAIVIIISSFVLWRYIERPFLRRSNHYRQGGTS